MRTFLSIIASGLLLVCNPSWSEAAGAIAWNEFLALGKLPRWQSIPVSPNRQPPQGLLQVFIPPGQSVGDWSEMVSVSTYKMAFEPKAWVHNFVQGLTGICRKLDVLTEGAKIQIDPVRQEKNLPAAYQTYNALVHCQDPPASPNPNVVVKKHEVIWVKVIAGFGYTHIVQKQWHGDEITPGSVLSSADTRAAWQRWIDDVAIITAPLRSPK